MRTPVNWAIIDAAAEPALFAMLEDLDPPHASLYADPVPDEIGRLAPWLVQVTPEVQDWLLTRETPWGIFIKSAAEMPALRQHLRKFLHVQIPDEEKPVIFRFYDPRNIWPMLEILTPWDQHSFLGPVEAISTHYKGSERSEDFAALREQYPRGSSSRRKIMKITPLQMEQLGDIFEQRYIDQLIEKMAEWQGNPGTLNADDIGTTFRWLKAQGITDDRSIRGLFRLFYEKQCLTVDAFPPHYKAVLSDEGEEGVYKAESLLIQELGDVPL